MIITKYFHAKQICANRFMCPLIGLFSDGTQRFPNNVELPAERQTQSLQPFYSIKYILSIKYYNILLF
jgi:hypothetical protein